MVFFLIELLQEWGLKVPAVFEYFSTRMILSVLTGLLVSIFLGPWFIRQLKILKFGQQLRENTGNLKDAHEKKRHTPTMGGVLILFSLLCSLFLWMDWKSPFTLLFLLTTLFLGGVGACDDYLKIKRKNSKGLSMRKKLAAQVGFSAVIAAYLLSPPLTEAVHRDGWFAPPIAKEVISKVQERTEEGTPVLTRNVTKNVLSLQDYLSRLYVPFFKDPVLIATGLGIVLMGLFFVLVITGSSNAVNLTDGLDGLAAGSLLMVAGTLALIAFVSNHVDFARYLHILYIEGSGEIAIFLSAVVGACLGFLWYNAHPAELFMGDTGSLCLGGIIGLAAVLLGRELLLVIIGGIFVIEALSVILQVASYRWRHQKRIFLCAPLHHHYECKGLFETKVVVRFWIIGLLLALVGIASLKFQ